LDIRIGVTQSVKEVVVELDDDTDTAALKSQVEKAMGDDDAVLWLTDKKGREVAVLGEKISYVEIGVPKTDSAVGFGS
jgi:hypothetical protein